MTRVTLRTITMNIPSQKIISKDNVSIDIAAVAYYHIVDPTKSVIALEVDHVARGRLRRWFAGVYASVTDSAASPCLTCRRFHL